MITINVDPVAFLNVRWYGIMVALAITVLILWIMWQVKKGANVSYDTVLTAAVIGIPSGIVVSRLLHVIDRWGYYIQNPGQIISAEGLTIYGAVLGAALGIWVYSKFSNFRFSYLADLLAPGIILAQAIGRVGCTINGCCHGIKAPSWLPWGIIYPSHPYNYYVSPFSLKDVPLHPTQIYEIIFNLIVFGVLFKLKGRFKPDGSLFLIYLGIYSSWRIGISFLREGTPFLLGLHQAQVIGLIVLAIAIFWLVYKARWVKTESSVQ